MVSRFFNILKKLQVFAKGHNTSFASVLMRALYLYFYRDLNLDDQIFNQSLNPNIPLAKARKFVGNREFSRFQRSLNSPYIQCISDKTTFAHLAKSFGFRHPDTFLFFEHSMDSALSHGLRKDLSVLSTKDEWLGYLAETLPERFIIKSSHGRSGQGIEVFQRCENGTFRGRTRQYSLEQIYAKVVEQKVFGKCIFQKYLDCHDDIVALTGSHAVQTVRLITVKNDIGEISLYCGFFKMVGSPDCLVDNFKGGTSGNLMASLDLVNGTIVEATGFDSSTYTHRFPETHPVTQRQLSGFKLPHWQELVRSSTDLHAKMSSVRIIGWDVAITNDGPVILEGNPENGDMSPSRPWMTTSDLEYLKSLLFTPKKHRFPVPALRAVGSDL